jgi:hypothetical protein
MPIARITKLDKFYEDLYVAAAKLSQELVVVARVNELLSGIVSLIDEIRYQPTNTNYVEGIKQRLKVLEKYNYHLIISPQLDVVLELGKRELPPPVPVSRVEDAPDEVQPVVECKKCGNHHVKGAKCSEAMLVPVEKKRERVISCTGRLVRSTRKSSQPSRRSWKTQARRRQSKRTAWSVAISATSWLSPRRRLRMPVASTQARS